MKNPPLKKLQTDKKDHPTQNEILCESCEREQNLFNYCIFDLGDKEDLKITKAISKSSKFFPSLYNVQKAIQSDSSRKWTVFDKTWSLDGSKVQLNLQLDKDQMEFLKPCSDQKFGLSCQFMRLLYNFVSRPLSINGLDYSSQVYI